jgi:hypothetical protein
LVSAVASRLSAYKRQVNAPERAPLGVPGKGERCGSEGACAPLDSANGLGL